MDISTNCSPSEENTFRIRQALRGAEQISESLDSGDKKNLLERVTNILWHEYSEPKLIKSLLQGLSFNPLERKIETYPCSQDYLLKQISQKTGFNFEGPEKPVATVDYLPLTTTPHISVQEAINFSKQFKDRRFENLAIAHTSTLPKLVYASQGILEKIKKGYESKKRDFEQLKEEISKIDSLYK